ncbi:porin [Sulfitobacter sp. F26169L]|uniref:porin n=1 Tax=Sulfitobacter sp. F26169L TaxID=2996015 RepID=UPI0022609F5E|nr:porin [Sulfitobacter sp. F26169L]MCX7565664.1 porin [Sulfitobacter sp. F26169L]
MKKVLFATTALVATAGVAAADVTFSGYGRFGVRYVDNGVTDSTDVTSRFRLQIDATAESDAGVTIGARVRLEGEERDAAVGSRPQFNGVRYFARSGGLEVGVGNIFGALEFMPGMYPIDLGLTGHSYDYTAYNFRGDAYQSGSLGSAGANGVEVLYSAGDFSAHLSASERGGVDRIAAHVAYSWNGWTFALAGQDSDVASDTEFAASVGGSFGIADVTLAYADNGTAGDHVVLTGRFDVGAATDIEVYVADADYWEDTGFGIDFNHDMGGGTSLRGGISTGGSMSSVADSGTQVDLGVRFNF